MRGNFVHFREKGTCFFILKGNTRLKFAVHYIILMYLFKKQNHGMIRFARELNSIFLRFQIERFSCIGITSAIKCININFNIHLNFFLAKTTDSVLHFLARE